MTRLEKLRKRLGQCDEILLDAILMRHHIIKDIMAYKEENGLNILDPEQEERQKEWLDGRLEDESNASEVWDIFHAIGKASKQMQARKLFDYNIVLIGFMGAGKTSISEYLKTLFAMDVIEMDQIIAEREGNTYTVKDDREVLQFYYEHREDSTEKMVHAVCKNTEFWGEDLTEIEGFESAVCGYLDQIRKEGSYSVMKSLISLD